MKGIALEFHFPKNQEGEEYFISVITRVRDEPRNTRTFISTPEIRASMEAVEKSHPGNETVKEKMSLGQLIMIYDPRVKRLYISDFYPYGRGYMPYYFRHQKMATFIERRVLHVINQFLRKNGHTVRGIQHGGISESRLAQLKREGIDTTRYDPMHTKPLKVSFERRMQLLRGAIVLHRHASRHGPTFKPPLTPPIPRQRVRQR